MTAPPCRSPHGERGLKLVVALGGVAGWVSLLSPRRGLKFDILLQNRLPSYLSHGEEHKIKIHPTGQMPKKSLSALFWHFLSSFLRKLPRVPQDLCRLRRDRHHGSQQASKIALFRQPVKTSQVLQFVYIGQYTDDSSFSFRRNKNVYQFLIFPRRRRPATGAPDRAALRKFVSQQSLLSVRKDGSAPWSKA